MVFLTSGSHKSRKNIKWLSILIASQLSRYKHNKIFLLFFWARQNFHVNSRDDWWVAETLGNRFVFFMPVTRNKIFVEETYIIYSQLSIFKKLLYNKDTRMGPSKDPSPRPTTKEKSRREPDNSWYFNSTCHTNFPMAIF